MTTCDIEVRKAAPDDAPYVAALYRQLVDIPAVTVLPERIAEIANDKNTALFVCEYDGEPQGTALVSLCSDVMFGSQPFAVVENVVVGISVRGRGIGTTMLRHIEAFCSAKDCSKIMLLSSVQRDNAHQFFERSGFIGSSKLGFVKYRSAFKATI
ncbi:MAG: GNAT family N-acetyltransferase [Rhodocyclales bacterium]|nr:GNAT family N-acetyltransferase [Rhodocyclales bacterium]